MLTLAIIVQSESEKQIRIQVAEKKFYLVPDSDSGFSQTVRFGNEFFRACQKLD